MRPKKRKNMLALSTLPETASLLRSAAARYAKLIKKQNAGRRNSSDSSVRSPTSTSSDVRSPTRTRTATSTDAYTAGNITVTGGAGAGATKVTILQRKPNEDPKGGKHAPRNTSKSNGGKKNPSDTRNQRETGYNEGLKGKYKTGSVAWGDFFKHLFSNEGRSAFLSAFKRGAAARRKGEKYKYFGNPNTSKSNGKHAVCKASNGRGKVERYSINLGQRKANTAKLQRALKTRRNGGDSDASMAERYEYFHGRAPKEVIDIKTRITDPLHQKHSGIGKLIALEIFAIDGSRTVTLGNFKNALLSQDKKGTQLYIDGGDQSVTVRDFGITRPHELEILGALTTVVYFTTKEHLTPETGGTANYDHKFGGEGRQKKHAFGKHGSRLPLVGYDVRNKLLSIQGGGYELPAEGIDG